MTSKATNARFGECVAFRDDISQCNCVLCLKAMAIYKAEQNASDNVSPWAYLMLCGIAALVYAIAAYPI